MPIYVPFLLNLTYSKKKILSLKERIEAEIIKQAYKNKLENLIVIQTHSTAINYPRFLVNNLKNTLHIQKNI